MTMPHLSNCEHADEGWCLACVRELWNEKELAESNADYFKKIIADLEYLDDEARHGASEMQRQLDEANCFNAMNRARIHQSLPPDYLKAILDASKQSAHDELAAAVIAAIPLLKHYENQLASSLSCDSRSHDNDREPRRLINAIFNAAKNLK